MRSQWSYLLSVVSLLLSITIIEVGGLGCFKCTSINHNNPECEDTFNSTMKFWEGDCWSSRKGRMGAFPGTQCIKMIAEDDDTGFSVVVRNCVVDNGGTNSETEIGRLTHCGWLRTIDYSGKRMRGCILACETDGCNMAALPAALSSNFLFVLTSCVFSAVLTL
ncbi:uncharacterized protein [Littorina saxatilis]|uniref:Protein quiver n=1 Tax=Littorina saxatilis TaxID=31220 RepID=A0AAN9BPM5_9CAEN